LPLRTWHGAAGPCAEQEDPPGRWPSVQYSPSLSDFLPRCQSHSSLSLSPRLAAGDELELELLPRLADDGGVMEPMNVDNGGCGGLDAQIEQLMQCRPLAEQEVRSSSAMSPFHSGFRYARR